MSTFFKGPSAPEAILTRVLALAEALAPISGDGPPAASLGLVGSIYIDMTDEDDFVLYGPKTAAGWGSGKSIKGPPGGTIAARFLEDLKAADPTGLVRVFGGSVFSWSNDDYSETPVSELNVNVVKANALPLTVGAWVRQTSAGITYAPPSAPRARMVQEELNDTPPSLLSYYLPTDGANYKPALDRALAFYDANPVNPPAFPEEWGKGYVHLPRGNSPFVGRAAYLGLIGGGLRGQAEYSNTISWGPAAAAEVGFKFTTYISVRITDLRVVHLNGTAPTPGSVGIELNPTGGGGNLQIKRLSIENFDTGILVGGVGNGDKTLLEGVSFYCNVAWSNGANKQAIGWTLLNCNGGGNYMLRYGGAGQVVVTNATYNPEKALILLPEGGGGEVAGNIVIEDTKLEYHGVQDRRMLDASLSILNADAGGSRAVVVLRNVTYDGGSNVPPPTSRATIQIGNGVAGSDGIVVQSDGGSWNGRISIASAIDAPLPRRWHFRDMKLNPNPGTVDFEGTGAHPLLEWTACDGTLDQYRGGQAFNGSFDLLKGCLFRSIGKNIINTGIVAQQELIAGRRGRIFQIAGFAVGTSVAGLRVYLTKASTVDLQVQQVAGPVGDVAIGPVVTIPAGSPKGSYRIHSEEPNLGDGVAYVRMTLPGTGQAVEGALIVEYMAYMGI